MSKKNKDKEKKVNKKTVEKKTVVKKETIKKEKPKKEKDVEKKETSKSSNTTTKKNIVVDKEKVAKKKEQLKKKEIKRKEKILPDKLNVQIEGVANPLVEKRRGKMPLAVMLARLISDKEKLYEAIRISGIPFKLVKTKEQAVKGQVERLCNKDMDGRSYGEWGIKNKDVYYEKNKQACEEMRPFAEAICKHLKISIKK